MIMATRRYKLVNRTGSRNKRLQADGKNYSIVGFQVENVVGLVPEYLLQMYSSPALFCVSVANLAVERLKIVLTDAPIWSITQTLQPHGLPYVIAQMQAQDAGCSP